MLYFTAVDVSGCAYFNSFILLAGSIYSIASYKVLHTWTTFQACIVLMSFIFSFLQQAVNTEHTHQPCALLLLLRTLVYCLLRPTAARPLWLPDVPVLLCLIHAHAYSTECC